MFKNPCSILKERIDTLFTPDISVSRISNTSLCNSRETLMTPLTSKGFDISAMEMDHDVTNLKSIFLDIPTNPALKRPATEENNYRIMS